MPLSSSPPAEVPLSPEVVARAEAFPLGRLHAVVTGPEEAPPLLSLHGWGSSAALMAPASGAVESGFRVHTLDLPGHGLTPPPAEGWGVPEYAALVARYLDAQGVAAPLPALGHSNGGRILLHMAASDAYAGWFSKLVLVSPSGVTPLPSPEVRRKRALARMLRAPFERLPDGRLKDEALDWLRHTYVWQRLGSSDYNALSGTMRETFVKTVGFHVDDRLKHIRVPVLVLWGDRDTAVSRHQVDVLAREIPDCGLVVLEGAAHYGYLDRMDVFAAATRHFLGIDGAA